MTAPVILFCYNRLDHLKQVVEALRSNDLAPETDLIVYSDYPASVLNYGKVLAVRDYLRTISGFKLVTVVERPVNWGIERNVEDATRVVGEKYGRFIVLEDDVVPATSFLSYMNSALDYYENESQILTVSGYSFPEALVRIPHDYAKQVYFCPRNCSYGWASWNAKLATVEWDLIKLRRAVAVSGLRNRIRSFGDDLIEVLYANKTTGDVPWDYRICINQILRGQLTVYPVQALTHNIGFDDTGLHSKTTNIYDNDITSKRSEVLFTRDLAEDSRITRYFWKLYRHSFRYKIFVLLNRALERGGYQLRRVR